MNEELIDATTTHCDFYVGNEHWDKSYEEQQRLWVHKFAELIVRECANLHDFNSGYYDDNNEWCAYYDKILKHFGVEE